jgi:O-antigen/teichoic acid export membrane protein
VNAALSRASRTRQILRPVFSAEWQWIFVAQLANVVGTWAVVKVVSNLAGAAQFGRFGIIIAVAYAVNTLLFGPLAGWAQRHYQEAREAGSFHAYYRAAAVALIVCTVGGTVLPLTVGLLAPRLLARVELTRGSLAVALGLGIVLSYCDIAIAIANAAFQRRAASVFLVATTWVRVAAVLAAWTAGARTARALAAAMIVGIALIVPVQVWLLLRDRRSWVRSRSDNQSFMPSLLHFMLPLVVWGLPGYVLTTSDRFLLAYFSGPAVVGVYIAMAAATINVGNAFSAAANRVLEPWIYSASGAGVDPVRIRRAGNVINTTTGLAVIASLPLVAVYALWPKPVIAFFSSSAYGAHAGLLWLMLCAAIIFLVAQQLMLHGLVVKRIWIYVPIKFVHASMLAAALIVLIPREGLSGVVYALLLAHSVQLAMITAANRLLRGRAPAHEVQPI